MKYRIEILREKCISAASCVALAPETFDLDDEGIATVKTEPADTSENILAAAQSCPVGAIVIYDEAGNQVWPEKKH